MSYARCPTPWLFRALSLALIGWSCLAINSRVASADAAGALVKFQQTIDCNFIAAQFPSDDYGTTIFTGGTGSGHLTSLTNHGNVDLKDLPTTTPFGASTSSTGDGGETTSQTVLLGALDSQIYISTLTTSDSQAATLGLLDHSGSSSATALALKHMEVTRLTTSGLAPVPHFYLDISAPAGAVHLQTQVLGNATAISSASVYLSGKIQNLALPGQPVEDLPPVTILTNRITDTDDWLSPEASGGYFLDLPDWTRLTGAHFNLDVGLQLSMLTLAEVSAVPEPATLCMFGMALVGLCVRRNKPVVR